MARIIPFDTLSGSPLLRGVPVSKYSWTSSITRPGEGRFVVQLRDAARPFSRNVVNMLSRGWGTSYAVVADLPGGGESVEYAGLVVSADWDEGSGELSVRTLELGAILNYRLLFALGQHANGSKVLVGERIDDVIRQAYRYALVTQDTGSKDQWQLPIDLPLFRGPTATSKVTRPYYWYNFESAASFIDNLLSEKGAPDVMLTPYRLTENLTVNGQTFPAGAFRWRLDIGDPLPEVGFANGIPRMARKSLRVPVAAPGSRIASQAVDLVARAEFSGQRTGVFAIGAGSEQDIRWQDSRPWTGTGTPIARDIPFLDATVAYKRVDDWVQLKQLAYQELADSAWGTIQMNFSIQTEPDGRIAPGTIAPGAMVALDHPGSEFIEKGRYMQYVLACSSDESGLYKLETQEAPNG